MSGHSAAPGSITPRSGGSAPTKPVVIARTAGEESTPSHSKTPNHIFVSSSPTIVKSASTSLSSQKEHRDVVATQSLPEHKSAPVSTIDSDEDDEEETTPAPTGSVVATEVQRAKGQKILSVLKDVTMVSTLIISTHQIQNIASGQISLLPELLKALISTVTEFAEEFKNTEPTVVQLRKQLRSLIQDGKSLIAYPTDATAKTQLTESVSSFTSMVQELIGSRRSTASRSKKGDKEGMEHVERLLRRMAQQERIQFEPSTSNTNSENYWREKVSTITSRAHVCSTRTPNKTTTH